jgi:AcrR family transcriptional regulator
MAPESTPNRPPGRRRGKRGTLSRERIARTVLELADREGVDAVSMRRLARELGVGTMTLYGYFRSREELMDAAVDLATEALHPDVGKRPWKEELRGLFQIMKEGLAGHPSGVQSRLARPMLSPGALRLTEAGMAILTGAGFSRRDAAHAYRALFLYTFGFAAFSTPTDPEDVKRHTRATLAALPQDEYPVLSAASAEAAATMAGDEQFEFGLECLLEGLERRLEAAGKK